jgi:YVTN family beta-propeller protein
VAPTQDRLFVTNQYENTVSVIDAGQLNVIGSIEVGEYPEGISVHPDGIHVYVANWFSNDVSVVDARTLKLEKTIQTGNGSRAFGEFIAQN